MVVAGMVLAGCGTTRAGEDGGSAQQAGFADRKMSEMPESPLSEYFGAGDLSGEDAEAQMQAQEQATQESIRDCMAEQGFEYVPFVPDWGDMAFVGGVDFENLTQREYAEQHGFGISTYDMDEAATEEDPYADDPNTALREQLGDSERAAYEAALYGAPMEMPEGADGVDVEMAEVPEDQMGCEQKAYENQGGEVSTLYESLDEGFTEMDERVTSDERMVEATKDYVACMQEAGYDGLTEIYDIHDQFGERLSELAGSVEGEDPFADFSEDELAAMSEEEIEALFPEPADIDPAALEALREEEIAAAVADLGCREETEPLMAAVRAEYEQQFVDENRDVLEQIKAAEGG